MNDAESRSTSDAGHLDAEHPLQWEDPVTAYDEDGAQAVDNLLKAAAGGGPTLCVLGTGFDPRCTAGLRRLIQATADVHVVALDLTRPNEPADLLLAPRRDANRVSIEQVVGPKPLTIVPYPDVHERSSAGRLYAKDVQLVLGSGQYRHIVVDVSAMPTSISFPILKGLLQRCKEETGSPELQVLVTENPDLDGLIVESGVDEAQPVAGFAAPLNRAVEDQLRVWVPILGREAGQSMRKVHELLDPAAIHPVLPFPSRNPRRSDDLFLEHRQLLIDELDVRPRDYIYAAERNPFDVYRTLIRFTAECKDTLSHVGGAVVTISCHSSKLLSVGALLAAYIARLPVVTSVPNSYRLDAAAYEPANRAHDSLACLWLRGDPYRGTN